MARHGALDFLGPFLPWAHGFTQELVFSGKPAFSPPLRRTRGGGGLRSDRSRPGSGPGPHIGASGPGAVGASRPACRGESSAICKAASAASTRAASALATDGAAAASGATFPSHAVPAACRRGARDGLKHRPPQRQAAPRRLESDAAEGEQCL